MTPALYKHDTKAARSANLTLAPRNPPRCEPALPNAAEIEIRQLRDETVRLEAELENLRGDWNVALADAYERAKAEAARAHVGNEAATLEAIDKCLDDAKEDFSRTLAERVEPLATSLAAAAFGKLVELNGDEPVWLSRVILKRLEQIAAGSLVSMHFSPDTELEPVSKTLHDYLAHGADVHFDSTIPRGRARIVLQLGEIVVDPDEGVAQLMRSIDPVEAPDG